MVYKVIKASSDWLGCVVHIQQGVHMKTITNSLLATALLACGLPGVGMAGPLDQIKNLRIDASALKPAQRETVTFQFANFKLTRLSSDMPEAWFVELSHSQAVDANVYVLKSVVHDGAGNVLHSGDDIVLPAARAGKRHALTRPLPTRSGIASLTLQVFNQLENRVVATQSYPLSAIAAYGAQGATTARGATAPQQAVQAAPVLDAAINHAVTFTDKADGSGLLTIQNHNNFPLRINALMQRADFSAGHASFGSILSTCSTQQIPAGGEASCRYDTHQKCSAVKALDFKLTLNGNTFFHDLKRDNVILPIPHAAIGIAIRKETSFNTQYIQGPGIAEIRIRGNYLKPGESVVMKGIMSVDSHDFPVVFAGQQDEYLITGRVAVEGKRVEAPERVCFRLMEITTNDDLSCGGVGIVLYRNVFDSGASQVSSKDFFGQIHCK